MNLVINESVDAMIDLSLTPKGQQEKFDQNQLLIKAQYQHIEITKEYVGLSKASKWGPHYASIAKALYELSNEGKVKKLLDYQINE